ncbi:MBL fold metallo-hydrolase [bacterium]|nr:MBL fold metallo-hydrolase [bacterium]
MATFSIQSLASGSGGNAYVITADSTRLLVDAGLSARQITLRLATAGIAPESIDGVLLTHEHHDHICGIPVLSRRFRYRTWAIEEAATSPYRRGPRLCDEPGVAITPISASEAFTIGGISIRPFSVSHDAIDPVMFTFDYAGRRIALCTDLGIVTRLVRERIREANVLVVESNHDVQMLEDGPYPRDVKRRVRGKFGHLSNEEAQELVRDVAHPGLHTVVLGHLSETNNTPKIAASGMRHVLDEILPDCRLLVAAQHEIGEAVFAEPAPAPTHAVPALAATGSLF